VGPQIDVWDGNDGVPEKQVDNCEVREAPITVSEVRVRRARWGRQWGRKVQGWWVMTDDSGRCQSETTWRWGGRGRDDALTGLNDGEAADGLQPRSGWRMHDGTTAVKKDEIGAYDNWLLATARFGRRGWLYARLGWCECEERDNDEVEKPWGWRHGQDGRQQDYTSLQRTGIIASLYLIILK
jgi:hypothetical protein